jgi:hypothetical protein
MAHWNQQGAIVTIGLNASARCGHPSVHIWFDGNRPEQWRVLGGPFVLVRSRRHIERGRKLINHAP